LKQLEEAVAAAIAVDDFAPEELSPGHKLAATGDVSSSTTPQTGANAAE
jgi:hypothetical protein